MVNIRGCVVPTRPQLCSMLDRFDPSNKATGGISGTQPTIHPGREDLRKEFRIFKPGVLKSE